MNAQLNSSFKMCFLPLKRILKYVLQITGTACIAATVTRKPCCRKETSRCRNNQIVLDYVSCVFMCLYFCAASCVINDDDDGDDDDDDNDDDYDYVDIFADDSMGMSSFQFL